MQPWSQPLLWTAAAAHDPYWSNVVLLMGFEGANGSTGAPGMTDESPAAHGTAIQEGVNNATISTVQKKFGNSSLLTNIANQTSIGFSDSNDWNLSSGQFTVELFFYANTVGAGRNMVLVCQWVGGSDMGWKLMLSGASGNQLQWLVTTNGATILTDLTGGAVSTGTWHYVAVDYDGVKYRLYLDGTTLATSSTARNIWNSSWPLGIGAESSDNNFWLDGYIDELRITKGVARYASDSGYTVPTAAFPRS